MGSYLDTSWADLFAITRERRAAARAQMLAAQATHEALSFPAVPRPVQDEIEAAWLHFHRPPLHFQPHVAWKNTQWAAGNRRCGYCGVGMTRTPNMPRTCTVDHRKPRAFGGVDDPSNWILSCLRCNNLKDSMSEAQFRALICRAA